LRAVSGAQLTVLNYEGVAGAAKVFMPARLLLKICIKLRATGFDHRFRRQTKKCDLHSNVQWPQDRVPELASWLKQHSTILKEHNIGLVMAVHTENPIRLLDTYTYWNQSLIILTNFANPRFVILLPIYDPLPCSLFPFTLLLCASPGTAGGNPRPLPTAGHSQPNI